MVTSRPEVIMSHSAHRYTPSSTSPHAQEHSRYEHESVPQHTPSLSTSALAPTNAALPSTLSYKIGLPV